MSYDISDDKRRETVYKMLFGYGDHAQYSVFFCELNGEELAELRGKLRKQIDHGEDQVMLIDLGLAENPLEIGLEVIGLAYTPPARITVV
ncbi:MAG: CRISPR-associated endonuclease Cas2 [Gemmatimonadales bacterium]